MKLVRPSLSLPILVKELTEMAARRRTYSLRFLYAALMFVFLGFILYGHYERYGASPQILGKGNFLFYSIMSSQFFALCFFLPAMIAVSMTAERENKTLPLLLLTDLRPWEIVVQKLFGRLVPLFTFYLLALPMGAVAYMLGGVDSGVFWRSAFALVLVSFQVGCVCMSISASCKTTVGAVMSCYLLGPMVYMAAVFMTFVVGMLYWGLTHSIYYWFTKTAFEWTTLAHAFPAALLAPELDEPFHWTLINSVPAWIVCLFFLRSAKIGLLGAASMSGHDPMMEAIPHEATHRRRPRELPGDEPVAWRQRHSLMGRSSSIWITAGLLAWLLFPFFLAFVDSRQFGNAAESLHFWSIVVWVMASVLMVIQGAGAFSTERSRDTLTVLLTTPMSGAQLLREKMAGMRRWYLFTTSVLMGMAVLQELFRWLHSPQSAWMAPFNLLWTAAALAIYLPLLAWMSLAIGLLVEKHSRAILASLTILVLWGFGFMALPGYFLELYQLPRGSAWYDTLLLSPLVVLAARMQSGESSPLAWMWGPAWMLVTAHYAFYGALLCLLRWHVLKYADGYLGRTMSVPRAGSPPHADGQTTPNDGKMMNA